jgi:predicted GNAT family acetyltransferase
MTVNDNMDRSRYELVVNGEVAAIENYELRGDRIALVHTEVFGSHEGQGLARALVEEVLADVRRRGLGVLPECSYVRKVIAEHAKQYLDLVPSDARAEFDLPL